MISRAWLAALIGSGLLWSACHKQTPPVTSPDAASAAASGSAQGGSRIAPSGLLIGEIPPLSLPDWVDGAPRPGAGKSELSLAGMKTDVALWRTMPAPRPPLPASLNFARPRGVLRVNEPLRQFSARKPLQVTCSPSADPWNLRQQSMTPGEGDEMLLSWADYWIDFRECSVALLGRGELSVSVLLRWGNLPIVFGLRGPSTVTLFFPAGTRLSLPPNRNGLEIEPDAFVRVTIPARAGTALNFSAEIDGPRLVGWGNELEIPPLQERSPGRALIMIDLSRTVSDKDVVLAASFVQAP